MKRYEEYKATGTEWMPSIPVWWDIQKIGALFAQRKEKVSDKDFAPISVTKSGILPQLATAAKTDDGDNRKKVCVGDFVINSRSDRKGSCGVSSLEGSVSLINIVLEPREQLSGKYTHYLLRSHLFSEEFYRNGRGIVADLWTTRYSEMKTILLPVPPREEQDQIVRYLDWQVSKINRLIAAKRKQIGLLKEQERSVAVHYITHGCNPQAVMKDSGIDWVEMIPQHWDVLFLQQVAEERFVKNAGMLEDDLLSLSYGHIIRKDINTTDGLLPASFEGYQIVEKNDTVLRLTDLQNDHRSLRTGLVLERGIITSAYTCIKPRQNILPEYLQLQLHSADLCKVFYGLGGGVRQSIGYKDIRKLLMFVPPLEEQQEILDAIKRKSASSLPCYNKLEEEITVLQELRTRLISDVVTGQVDVRGIKAPDVEYTYTETREEELEETEEN